MPADFFSGRFVHMLSKGIARKQQHDEEKGKEMIKELVIELYTIARMLNPLMPETNVKLKQLIKDNKKPESPLFLRKEYSTRTSTEPQPKANRWQSGA